MFHGAALKKELELRPLVGRILAPPQEPLGQKRLLRPFGNRAAVPILLDELARPIEVLKFVDDHCRDAHEPYGEKGDREPHFLRTEVIERQYFDKDVYRKGHKRRERKRSRDEDPEGLEHDSVQAQPDEPHRRSCGPEDPSCQRHYLRSAILLLHHLSPV